MNLSERWKIGAKLPIELQLRGPVCATKTNWKLGKELPFTMRRRGDCWPIDWWITGIDLELPRAARRTDIEFAYFRSGTQIVTGVLTHQGNCAEIPKGDATIHYLRQGTMFNQMRVVGSYESDRFMSAPSPAAHVELAGNFA